MKKLFILFAVLFVTTTIFSQNVAINNDGTTANASAMLDVKSTTKGMLIPRMTSAQRSGILTPALGLLVFDTDTKTIWAYDGAAWVNLSVSGSGFTLPIDRTVTLPGNVVRLVNTQGTSIRAEGNPAISAYSPLGNAINAFADYGNAVNAQGKGSAAALNAYNPVGIAIYAQSALADGITGISNGSGKTGVSGQSGNGAGVAGKSTSGAGVDGKSTGGYGVSGQTTTTSANGAAVYGLNQGTKGSGVLGLATFAGGYGVQGLSNDGTGVFGISNYRGVAGNSINGSALYGNSTNGYGLEVSGKVKIAGGNTNPQAGAILTSDASGNATWQKPTSLGIGNKIAFKTTRVASSQNTLVDKVWKKIHFGIEAYDYSSNYNQYTSGTPTADASTFLVPINGLYHFDANLKIFGPALEDLGEAWIRVMLKRGNSVIEIALTFGALAAVNNDAGTYDVAQLSISIDEKLQTGDKIWIEVYQECGSNLSISQAGTSSYNQFSGHLIFAD